LENPKRSGELEIAAQCLAHAYHYLEDIGDFSEGNKPLRNSVSTELDYLYKNHTWARIQIDDRKRNIQPNRDKIIDVLKRLKRQKISSHNSDQIRNALFLMIASLEQMNIFFLDAVNQQLRPQPQAKPQPPTDNRKWIVWHGCAGPSFACVIELSRTTEIELRQSGRKVTIMGTYNTGQEARQATCAKFTGIRAGGQFAAGTLGNIGKDVYCVNNFFYYDSRENRYKCR
jgi:hypothetical protein